MATVAPFRALRPRPNTGAAVAAVPYDVVDTAEARALAQGNPLSFLHVTKPEIDLPEGTDPYSDAVYAQGSQAFKRLEHEGVLVRDPSDSFYVYALTMAGHVQTGVVLLASVAEYEQNVVRKHEHTRPDKETDRVRHLEATRAQTGTVFLVHRDHAGIAQAVAATTRGKADVDFIAQDGVRHQLWRVDAQHNNALVHGFAEVGPIYIADGHHRSAAAARVAATHRDVPAAQRFLAVSFPASEVQILPYNRVVKDLAGKSPKEFLAAVEAGFEVRSGKPASNAKGQFGMYLDGQWHTLVARQASSNDPVQRLDVSVLQDQLLAPLLGIDDPRRDKRIDFVGGIRGDAELERRVQSGASVAFSLHPTAVADLFAIADANQVMPPKSTWFEPKLRDGLVVHTF